MPSHMLRAIGVTEESARGSIRFGLGRFNDEAEVDYVAERVISEVERLRGLTAGNSSHRSASGGRVAVQAAEREKRGISS